MTNRIDFFLVGAARSGTTSLCNYLQQHPSIFIPDIKEPHFFGQDLTMRNTPSLEAYQALYTHAPDGALLGDASTHYLCSRTAAKEIYKYNPAARIIVILREPCSRAYSHYRYRIKSRVESRSFEDAIEDSIATLKNPDTPLDLHPYATMSLYSEALERYIDTFSQESVKVLLYDDLQKAPETLCCDTLAFLGQSGSPDLFDTKTVYNRAVPVSDGLRGRLFSNNSRLRKCWHRCLPEVFRRTIILALSSAGVEHRAEPGISQATRHSLGAFFAADIDKLETLIGRDLSHWKQTASRDGQQQNCML